MSHHQKFPAKYSRHSGSFLSGKAQDACHELGKATRLGNATRELITEFRASYRNVVADAVPQTSNEIRDIAELYRVYELQVPKKRWSFRWLFSKKPSGNSTHFSQSYARYADQLDMHPDLGWLLLFSADGFVRQAAIEALTAAPQCPFEFTAIVYRLNDWVGNVRSASSEYCKQHLENTSAHIVTESAFFLLHQTRTLKRWDQTSKDLLQDAICRPAVMRQLKDKLLSARNGRVGAVFQQILQRPDFDQYLLELSKEAALPIIRAKASEVLLNRRAQWFVGYQKEWVDKSLGASRRVARFDSRPIEIDFQFDEVLLSASNDKSAHVRKVAADALIANRLTANKQMEQIALDLLQDRNWSVRSRAEFFARKRAEGK